MEWSERQWGVGEVMVQLVDGGKANFTTKSILVSCTPF